MIFVLYIRVHIIAEWLDSSYIIIISYFDVLVLYFSNKSYFNL